MITTIGLAILSFFISAAIGYLFLLYQVSNCTAGFACIGFAFTIPIYLAGGGIILTLPVYFLLRKTPWLIARFGKILAFLIILLVIILGLFIVPK